MNSGGADIQETDEAIGGMSGGAHSLDTSKLLRVHGFTVEDVDLHGLDDEGLPTTQQAIFLRIEGVVGDGDNAEPCEIEMTLTVDSAEALAMFVALATDKASEREDA